MFKIYVGNLDYKVKIEQLRELFSVFAPIEDLVIPADPKTKRSKGFAIVMIRDPELGHAAIRAMQGKRLLGRLLVVNEAVKRKKGIAPPTKADLLRSGPFGPRMARFGDPRQRGGSRNPRRGTLARGDRPAGADGAHDPTTAASPGPNAAPGPASGPAPSVPLRPPGRSPPTAGSLASGSALGHGGDRPAASSPAQPRVSPPSGVVPPGVSRPSAPSAGIGSALSASSDAGRVGGATARPKAQPKATPTLPPNPAPASRPATESGTASAPVEPPRSPDPTTSAGKKAPPSVPESTGRAAHAKTDAKADAKSDAKGEVKKTRTVRSKGPAADGS